MTSATAAEPTLRLTEWTSCGGCAAKWGAAVLADLVKELPTAADPALVVGLAPFDDAAVYRINEDTALVSTTDFFPPLVDDPSDYGAIAAANACSDVFAMGGRVVLAINVAAFPEHFPRAAMAAIFEAAAAVVAEAGGTVAGGHTIRNPEPVFGLAVQGLVDPRRVLRKAGARPGDAVFLSKPLGTGLVLAGAGDEDKVVATAGMRQLNRAASEVLVSLGDDVHAVTDVTGYGLAGHGWEVAERSGVRLVVDTDRLPLYPGALEAAARGVRTGGDPRNRDYVARAPRLDLSGGARCGVSGSADVRRAARRGLAGDRRHAGGCRVLLDRRGGGRSSGRRASMTARPVNSKKRAPTRSYERELWELGHDVVVGVDEVGRGAWAGPLMVGAVILPRDRRVNGIRDSKLLTAPEREKLFDRITTWSIAWGVGSATQVECDALGMSAAQRLAAERALSRLTVAPDAAVVDGLWDFVSPHVGHVERRIKADARCLSVAAASILAKVVRDREMRELAEHYPPWSFDTNKGYPCPVHKAALQAYGPSVIHRRSWIFMDHYVPWPGISRMYRAEQPTLF